MSTGLTVADLTYTVPEGDRRKPVLRGLSCNFDSGRFTCLSGPSGAGKTTLLSILALIVAPEAGEVRFDGRALSRLTAADRDRFRASHLSLVFQTLRLMEVMTVREHLELGSRLRGDPRVRARGEALLESYGLSAKLDHLPRQLSGGEKQRVALAQSLATCPSIVLADEPTAALDATNGDFVARHLADYAHTSGATVVCVSHDPVVHAVADEMCELQKI